MRTKIFILMLALMLVATFSFAAGKKETSEEGTAAPSEPQYGGILTYFHLNADRDPPSPAIAAGGTGSPGQYLSPICERPLTGDFVKYGPRGTGEFSFQLWAYLPEKYIKGQWLESWEVTLEKLVWHIRPGIMWADSPWLGFDFTPRELVADDVVFDLIDFKNAPGGRKFREYAGEIYATDRYTVVIEFIKYDQTAMYYIGYEDRANLNCPETVKVDANKWQNQVGTGPFVIKDYIPGSEFVFARNPDYWGSPITIDGKEYEIPFIDELVQPIIPDPSTQIAALRTGTIDIFINTPPTAWSTLDKTAPWLEKSIYASSIGGLVALNCSKPPFDNVDVRRAMMIGTDQRPFHDLQNAPIELPVHFRPVTPVDPDYIPLEKLPKDCQILFKYDPELAKKMLADSGYPDGFETTINTVGLPALIDQAAMLVDLWAKIGVKAEINTMDAASLQKITHGTAGGKAGYDGVIPSWDDQFGNSMNSLIRRGETGHVYNKAMWSNKRFDELTSAMVREPDASKRSPMIKEASIIFIRECPYVPLNPQAGGVYWTPWTKNYYGECNVQDMDIGPVFAHIWIDQGLKDELGY
jgi:ABC-type transport system substrate-binding protein